MSSKSSYLLCLDYGKAKVGVAVGSLVPTSPLDVVRYSSYEQLLGELQKVIESERPEGIVLGWPAEDLAITSNQTEEIRRFGDTLGRLTGLPIIYYPETLTTQLASRRMIEAGLSQKRRREMEDSYAAAAILDSYLQGLE